MTKRVTEPQPGKVKDDTTPLNFNTTMYYLFTIHPFYYKFYANNPHNPSARLVDEMASEFMVSKLTKTEISID